MESFSHKKRLVFDLFIVISIVTAIVLTYTSLTHQIYDVFPYFYLIPIVIIAYARPKWSIYGTVFVGWLYLALVFFIGLPEAKLYTLATLWFYIIVSIGILLSAYSQVYKSESDMTCASYYNSQAGAFSFFSDTLRITDGNRKFAEMLQYERKGLKHLSLPDIIPDTAERELFLAKIRDLHRIGNIEVGFLAANKNIRWTIVSAIEAGAPEIICTVVDITDQRNAQDALSLANKKLNLLNNVTRHDILNHLTALLGYIQLSKMEITDKQTLSFIAKEEQAAEAIKGQILFTRDYQNIGVNAPKWQNVSKMVSLALTMVDLDNIHVSVDLVPIEIYADPLLEKVFYNLIENSIRHAEGATTITITSRETTDGIDIITEDNGTGVPEEAKEKIFRRECFRNTGFGLFLSREILGITDLTLFENGIEGRGARFVIHAKRENFRQVPDISDR